MKPVEKKYNACMDRAVADLEQALRDKLALVNPNQVMDAISVENMSPQILTYSDKMTLDIIRNVYHMHGTPILEYKFFAISRFFGHSIRELDKDGKYKGRVEASNILGADGRPALKLVGKDEPKPDSE